MQPDYVIVGVGTAGALSRLHALDDQGLYWFEEPNVYDNIEACAQITREIKTPIQIGENIYGPREFYKAVVAHAADIVLIQTRGDAVFVPGMNAQS